MDKTGQTKLKFEVNRGRTEIKKESWGWYSRYTVLSHETGLSVRPSLSRVTRPKMGISLRSSRRRGQGQPCRTRDHKNARVARASEQEGLANKASDKEWTESLILERAASIVGRVVVTGLTPVKHAGRRDTCELYQPPSQYFATSIKCFRVGGISLRRPTLGRSGKRQVRPEEGSLL